MAERKKKHKNGLRVSIVMGSKSDVDIVKSAADVLAQFDVGCEMKVLSAHRTPKELAAYIERLPQRGVQVIIAAAGMAAALAGTIAAHTTLPVIGIPLETSTLKGLDSLLSTVQMPKGVPVACMAIGSAGAQNAALFACQILALQDRALQARLQAYKAEMAAAIRKITLT